MSVKVSIINTSGHTLPAYATDGSAGMDLRAYLTDAVNLAPMDRMLIPTGLFIALPEGYEAQIRPRSGLAIKHGITCLNSPGTIDCDYRGEIKVILINLGQENFVIQNGDRIAQMVVCPFVKVEWINVDSLSETERNDGGFGHSGC
jgi:dUTP pyrophosphatase